MYLVERIGMAMPINSSIYTHVVPLWNTFPSYELLTYLLSITIYPLILHTYLLSFKPFFLLSGFLYHGRRYPSPSVQGITSYLYITDTGYCGLEPPQGHFKTTQDQEFFIPLYSCFRSNLLRGSGLHSLFGSLYCTSWMPIHYFLFTFHSTKNNL